MNAEAFVNLKKLTTVWMMKNGCVDDTFILERYPNSLISGLKGCAFDEKIEASTQPIPSYDDATTQNSGLTPLIPGLSREMEAAVVGIAIFISFFSLLAILWLLKKMCC